MRGDNLKHISLIILSTFFVGCSEHQSSPEQHNDTGVAIAPQSITGNTLNNAGPTIGVSGGPNVVGVLAPTGEGVAARIENGLEKNAVSTTGSFAKSLAQVKTNLPRTANVMEASGFDQVQLLVYAACADLTTGGTPKMQTVYNVLGSGTIASNQAALVAAGMRMLDQHTAKIASQGSASAALTTIFTNLVQSQAAVGTNTSKIAFVAVCIAANTAGVTMLGL